MSTVAADGTAVPYRTRTEVLFAANGKSATVLRRGPRLHFHLLKWRLSDDSFESGQWMKGTVRLFDLNSAGDKLIYWARQWHRSAPGHDDADAYRPYGMKDWSHVAVPEAAARARGSLPRFNEGVWTAVSTPPWFTAFAIWPCLGHWTGGGFFADDRTLLLQETASGLTPKVNHRLPKALRRDTVYRNRPGSELGLARAPDYRMTGRNAVIAAALYAAGHRWVDWVYRPAGGDILYAADGQIFRVHKGDKAPVERLAEAAWLLIDLRPMAFELKKAPQSAFSWSLRHSVPARPRPAGRRGYRKGAR